MSLRFFSICAVLTLAFFVSQNSVALASGLNTTTSTQSGQVRVNQDGTTTYLSTQTNGDSTGSARTSTRSASLFGIGVDPDALPDGFFTDPNNLITNAINIAFIVAIILSFFYLIWAGFDWITSGGEKGKIDSARQKIINVVIGLVVVAASYALLTLALQLLGYTSLDQVLSETQQKMAK
jgi:hypothetical protein